MDNVTADTKQPTTPQERVIQEHAELQVKLDALNNMLSKPRPLFINIDQWVLMEEQYKHMWSYGNVLKKRIELF